MINLTVNLNDYQVGTLTLLPSGSILFSFNENYLLDPNRPVLSQSFIRPIGDLMSETRPVRGILPAFFSNLLPEGHMRDYLAQRGRVKPTQEFKLIELLGADLPGAVIILPTDLSSIVQEHETKSEHNEKPLRFSLAGVQLKFSAIAKCPAGLTIPANGYRSI